MTNKDNPMKTINGVPRRNFIDKQAPLEVAIRTLLEQVEAAGAHPLLTDVVTLLGQALDKAGDYVDLQLDDIASSPQVLLQRLVEDGGAIVGSRECSELEIACAQADGRMYVDDDGLGYVLRPAEFLRRAEAAFECLKKHGNG